MFAYSFVYLDTAESHFCCKMFGYVRLADIGHADKRESQCAVSAHLFELFLGAFHICIISHPELCGRVASSRNNCNTLISNANIRVYEETSKTASETPHF